MGIAAYPYLWPNGDYIGIDVNQEDIDFCKTHYPHDKYKFFHLDAHNRVYAPKQTNQQIPWPIEDQAVTAVTALSVWTHLNEDDAKFYFKEINRVLRNDGVALITFFLLDLEYESKVERKSYQKSELYSGNETKWFFDRMCPGSGEWYHTAWADVSEQALGVTSAGIQLLCDQSNLNWVSHHRGSFKDVPGVFFPDVLVFKKKSD